MRQIALKVYFETFGCRLNRAEALEREAEYLARGWEIAKKHSEADLFIVRGCSVTARAQHECEKMIAHLQKHYPLKRIIVEGCLKQNELTKPTKADLISMPKVIPVPTRTARAYLKVQDGCNGKCAFCIVPKFRGESKSIAFADVLDKAKQFIKAGYHEIVVTGCNLALYASEGKRLPELTAALAELSPDCRIRIGSIEPGKCALELVNAMAEHENCCRFLHTPIQSGSNRILTAMRRPYLVRDIEELLSSARRQMPTIGIGCDIMTGFPGETDIDFVMSSGLAKRLRFANIHIFTYSKRPGTDAAASLDQIPHAIRHLRARKLSAVSDRIQTKFAQSFLGQHVQVLIEDIEKRSGWTGEYLKCTISGKDQLTRKLLYDAIVTNVKHDTLIAKISN